MMGEVMLKLVSYGGGTNSTVGLLTGSMPGAMRLQHEDKNAD